MYVYFHMALYVDLRSQLWQLNHTPSWKTNLYCLTCSGVLYSFPQTSHLNVILWLFYYVKSPHPDSYQTYSKLFYINTIFKFTYCFTFYFTIFQFMFLRLRQIILHTFKLQLWPIFYLHSIQNCVVSFQESETLKICSIYLTFYLHSI